MSAIKTARRFIESQPGDPDARVLSALVLALESEESFRLGQLYTLPLERFELAVEVIRQWRLDRYYTGKAKLLDVSLQLRDAAADPVDPGE